MELSIDLWTEYLIRFAHLVAGISWIGSSFYFIWLDSAFKKPENPRHNVEGEVFMVHGGFYYQVEKKKIYPGEVPKVLHWFKWEATLTLITGYMLFIYLYYLNSASLLIDPQVRSLSPIQAIGISAAFIVVSWFLYDFIWHSRINKIKGLSLLLSLIYFSGLIYTAISTFSGRGAFIIVGVSLGTLMVLNVWIRILPGQSKMLKEALAGQIPDYSVSLKSKTRSVHNTYFIFPVLFIMLSNHYPLVYNHELNWLLLVVLSISGALVRHSMVTKKKSERWLLAPAAIGLLFLVYITANTPTTKEEVYSDLPESITYSDIEPIVQKHCVSCHSTNNTDDIYKVAPRGVLFETEKQLIQSKEKILIQVVQAKIMPLGNKTNMTEVERQKIAAWLNKL